MADVHEAAATEQMITVPAVFKIGDVGRSQRRRVPILPPSPGVSHVRLDDRDSGAARVKTVEEAVEFVGDVGVIERGGMRVVPQGSGRVPVAEAGLGLEQPPLVHQVGGHAVA